MKLQRQGKPITSVIPRHDPSKAGNARSRMAQEPSRHKIYAQEWLDITLFTWFLNPMISFTSPSFDTLRSGVTRTITTIPNLHLHPCSRTLGAVSSLGSIPAIARWPFNRHRHGKESDALHRRSSSQHIDTFVLKQCVLVLSRSIKRGGGI